MSEGSDLEFVARFRGAVTEYLQAVDAWERKHAQYYRLPSRSGQLTEDLAGEQRAYLAARKKLEELTPRARILYGRYDLREPFGMLLQVNLGAGAPQSTSGSAIGGNERTEIARGLVDLLASCAQDERPEFRARARNESETRRRSLWQRLTDFFG
jgi:hypothetical protein